MELLAVLALAPAVAVFAAVDFLVKERYERTTAAKLEWLATHRITPHGLPLVFFLPIWLGCTFAVIFGWETIERLILWALGG